MEKVLPNLHHVLQLSLGTEIIFIKFSTSMKQSLHFFLPQ